MLSANLTLNSKVKCEDSHFAWYVLYSYCLPLLKHPVGGQDVETVHQHFDGDCPFDVEYESHIPADALAISLIDFLVP